MPAADLVRCLSDILPQNPPGRGLHKGQELGSWNVTASLVPGTAPGVWQTTKELLPRTEVLTLQLCEGQERLGLREGKELS